MPLAANIGYDTYGHRTDWTLAQNAGFTGATSGSAAGTVVNPGTADPTGTTTLTPPNAISDGYGQFQITTAGSQTTGALRTIYFQNPYPVARPAVVSVTTTAGAAAGGTITVTCTTASLAISVGSGLTTSTTYNIAYAIL